MSKKAVIPGSFDPITNGHLDIIRRTAGMFDEVAVLVMLNSEKKYMFGNMRVEMVRAACADLANVRVEESGGLLCDYVNQNRIDVIVKGVRSCKDFEYEKDMAQINCRIGGCETLLITAKPELEFCSSTFVREMLRYGRDVSGYVPRACLDFYVKLPKQQ